MTNAVTKPAMQLGQATALRLLANLETQKTQTYCGIATTVTALNSIEDARSNAPLDPLYYPYKFYTQVYIQLSLEPPLPDTSWAAAGCKSDYHYVKSVS